MKEAYLYKPGKTVECVLCNRRCRIPEGGVGICGIRLNKKGKLYAMTYAKPCAINLDPIEKKPLFHFLPGSQSLSIATVGCNYSCLFCQNWQISQSTWDRGPQEEVPPSEVVRMAERQGAPSIAYTYTEPTIFYEYARDISDLASKKGIKNIFVTNGYMTTEMIDDYKSLNAANVDIKGDERFYKEVCGGIEMEHVLDSIRLMNKKKIWVEATNLIIPGYNDDDDSIKQISQFIKDTDSNIPLHFSAFFPQYKMKNTPPTQRETLVHAREIALEIGVNYVYCGNTYPGDPYENTYCPKCGELVIERHGFALIENKTKSGKSPGDPMGSSRCGCGQKIAGL